MSSQHYNHLYGFDLFSYINRICLYQRSIQKGLLLNSLKHLSNLLHMNYHLSNNKCKRKDFSLSHALFSTMICRDQFTHMCLDPTIISYYLPTCVKPNHHVLLFTCLCKTQTSCPAIYLPVLNPIITSCYFPTLGPIFIFLSLHYVLTSGGHG